MKYMNRKLLYGRIAAVAGIIIILANALNYLTNASWSVPSSATGLVFCIIGTILIKKSRTT